MKRLGLIFFLLSTVLSYAQELTVSVNKNPAIVGERISIIYSINASAENFTKPNFGELRVVSGPNISQQSSYGFSSSSGIQSQTVTTFSLLIKATKEGLYQIPPASVILDGQRIESKPLQIRVVKGNKQQQAQQKQLSKNLYIKVDVSKKNIVVGEQILVTYKLLTRYDLSNVDLSKLSDLNGFWVHDIKTNSTFKREIIDGTPYRVATIQKAVLTAQKAGELTIDPIELKCNIIVKRDNDPFSRLFNFGGLQQTQEEIVRSKTIKIKVSDPPKPPVEFKGAVGNMKISSEVDNSTANTNESIKYKVTIEGKGNVEFIESVDIDFPQDFKVFPPKISDKIFEGGMLRSTKTFEYLLIPKYEGEYTIPSSKLIIYNTKKKEYEIKKSNEHLLTINKGSNDIEENSAINQQMVKTIQEDISYIHTNTRLRKIGEKTLNKTLFYILSFLPILLILLAKIYEYINSKKNINNTEWKNKKANKLAQRRLKNAEKCKKNGDSDGFFEEIEKALWGYFADKFKVKHAELSKDKVTHYFELFEISKEIEKQFIALLNECEFARYTPASNKKSQMNTLLKKALKIIIKVETKLK